MTLHARSCPTCHSIGEPYVIDRTLGSNEPIRCKNLWHIEVREPERAGRFEELLGAEHEQFDRRGELLRSIVEYGDAPSGTVSVPAEPGVGQETAKGPRCWSCGGTGMLCSPGQLCMPSNEGATACTCPGAIPRDKCRPQEAYAEVIRRLRVATTDLSRVTRERDEARAQDCGHDLDAFQRQAEELTRLRERLDVAQTAYLAQADELADTVRRYEPVIEAAKAWVRAAQESPTFQTMGTFGAGKALFALKDATAALGDAGSGTDQTGERDA